MDYISQEITPITTAIIVIIITVASYGYGVQGTAAALFHTPSEITNAW